MDTCCTAEQLAVIGINPEDIALSLAFGMGLYVAFWALGFAVTAAIKAIRMA